MKGDRIMVAEKNAMKRTEYKFSWMTCVCARVYMGHVGACVLYTLCVWERERVRERKKESD